MQIIPYQNNSRNQAQLVDLINFCQNIEAQLNIKIGRTR
jgi:hypothetical protein